MKKIEKALFTVFSIVSILMFWNLIWSMFYSIDIVIFGEWIHYIFYLLAVVVPLWLLIQWFATTSKKNFAKMMVAAFPGISFSVWFITMLIALGEALSHF